MILNIHRHSLCGSVDWNIFYTRACSSLVQSLPLRECGLKLKCSARLEHLITVTPFAGVWIEITLSSYTVKPMTSLPLRECGLKLVIVLIFTMATNVTPFAGVWIEIVSVFIVEYNFKVTPFAGVWIEIHRRNIRSLDLPSHSLCGSVDWNCLCCHDCCHFAVSLPLRECGLKLACC